MTDTGVKYAAIGLGSALCMGGILKLCRSGLQAQARRRKRAEPAVDEIIVGTKNPCKLAAVRAVLAGFPHLADAQGVVGVAVPSGVADQPISIEETTKGAKLRAERAFASASNTMLAMGIESGVFRLDGGLYDMCVCAVYDGTRHALGMSSCFQLPKNVQAHVDAGRDLSEACNLAGLTADPKLGDGMGCIGILSRRRLLRQGYTEQAVLTALTAMDPEWFESRLPLAAFQNPAHTTA